MIEFKNVSCEYENGVKVIDDISFTINDGESVGLIGANGAGKSTIMKAALGLVEYTGSIKIDGLEVRDEMVKTRKLTGFVLQNSDNQMFMPKVIDDMVFGPVNYGMKKEEAKKKAEDILEKMGISYLEDKYNHKISGGEKRMAAIATVLCMDPEYILMDEPTAALDPMNRRTIINSINSIKKTKLITSHDLDMILDSCDRVILINKGRIVIDSDADKVLNDEKLLEENRLELPFSIQGIRRIK